MKKVNWVAIAAKGIEEKRDSKFVWGENDCCLAVADIVKDFSNVDIAEKFRGRYTTAIGSVRVLNRCGGGSIASAVSQTLKEVELALVSRGDVVLIETYVGDSLGLYFGSRVWAMTEEGLRDFDKKLIKKAWRV